MWSALYSVTEFLWGTPLIVLMIGVGLYLTIRSGVFQLFGVRIWMKRTLGEVFSKKTSDNVDGQLKPFQTLSAVLAGTVGSGNIAGVASAIAIGGPMYYMQNGLGKIGKILAAVYAVALFIMVMADACFVQTNTLAVCINDVFGVPLLVSGIVVVTVSLVVILAGGVETIGDFCGKMVPPMILVYIVGCLVVVILNAQAIPETFAMIFRYAFAPAPAAGGFAGAAISTAMAKGAARGIFSNEAGMGTATTVHATAVTDHPTHQGMYGVLEVFITGVIICTLTALAILSSGVWNNGNTGVVLSFDAFRGTWGQVGVVVLAIAVSLFTYSSYLGFFVEFRTCVEYLFGEKLMKVLKWLYFILPILSVTLEVEQVWDLADMAVGFIVIPNMIALLLLSPKFFQLFHEYLNQCKEK